MNSSRGFDQRFLEELKQKNDIVEVASSYIALDKKGNTHWACCPFHHERTPSFAVNQGEQFYHCFGCGVSGDVIKFVQEIESTDFMGAVQILATRAKMSVPETNYDAEKSAEQKRRRDKLLSIMLDTAKFYLHNLYSNKAQPHLAYIAKREISPSVVKKFGLGASLDFYSLPDYLIKKGYQQSELLESGVVIESKNGKLVDAQAGRLIFPIINAFDEVIAFGGRILEKADFAKYKNTKETFLFNKSKTLYNVNLLKKLKREQAIESVILVEGYMDTISLYQAGFKNVVASMGTSLTKDQARLLKRYTNNVLISYDGDFAGQKADSRGLEILKEEGLNVKVVPLPEGLDPDEVIKKGVDQYQKCLDDAMPLIDYKIFALERKYDLKKTEEKRSFLAEALKVVKESESEAEKEELLKVLQSKTGISHQALERDLQNTEVKKESGEDTKIYEADQGTDKYIKAGRFVLAGKLFNKPYAQKINVGELYFENAEHRLMQEYIVDLEKRGLKVRASGLFEVMAEDATELNAVFDLNTAKMDGEPAERYFFDSVKVLENGAISKKIEELQRQFNEESEVSKRAEIAKQLNEYTKRKNKR